VSLDPNYRPFDYPYKQLEKDKKPKKEDVKGVLCAVSDLLLEIHGSPAEMIKHHDPKTVKQSSEWINGFSRGTGGGTLYLFVIYCLSFRIHSLCNVTLMSYPKRVSTLPPLGQTRGICTEEFIIRIRDGFS